MRWSCTSWWNKPRQELVEWSVRLISTGPVQRLGQTLTRVLIGDAQPKIRQPYKVEVGIRGSFHEVRRRHCSHRPNPNPI